MDLLPLSRMESRLTTHFFLIVALSPQATTVYNGIARNGVPGEILKLVQQLCDFDYLFGWVYDPCVYMPPYLGVRLLG